MVRVEQLEAELAGVTIELRELRERQSALESSRIESIYVHSLGDNRVSVVKPIPVALRCDGDEFIASFLEANVSSGGASVVHAISNLQSLLADIASDLQGRDNARLGKSMRKQKQVLAEFLSCQKS